MRCEVARRCPTHPWHYKIVDGLLRGQRTSVSLHPVDVDRQDEKPEGTEYLVCGASFLCEDGTQHTCTLLPDHPSGHTDIPAPSVVED